MKKVVILIIIGVIIGCSQEKVRGGSVDFRSIGYEEALALAKAEGKHVFLYFHFEGCGACKQLENSAFVDAEVTEYINKKFVCLDVNTSHEKGRKINTRFRYSIAPTCMVVDAEGDPLYAVVGYYVVSEFFRRLKNGDEESAEVVDARRRYRHGERDDRSVREYIDLLQKAHLPYTDVLNEYIDGQSEESLAAEENVRLLYNNIVEAGDVTMPYGSRGYNAFLKNREALGTYFPVEQIEGRILAGLQPAIYSAIEQGNGALLDSLIAIAESCSSTDMIILEDRDGEFMFPIHPMDFTIKAKMSFFRRSGDKEKYRIAFEQFLHIIWDNAPELNNLAWSFYQKATDPDSLHLASMWAQRSIALESTYQNNDTYAALLFKLGQHREALAQAEKAVAIAKKKGENHSTTTELIDKIKKAMK